GIETHAGCERQAAFAFELLCEATKLLAEMEGGVAGTMRVVLVRQRCSEERHHAVTGVLVDRAFEAMNAFGEDLEEAIENTVPLFGIDLLGELHGAGHVGEEHGDLLALALDRAA